MFLRCPHPSLDDWVLLSLGECLQTASRAKGIAPSRLSLFLQVVAAPDVKDLLLPTDFGRQNPVPSAATTRRPTQPAKNDTHPPCAPALSNNVNPPEFGPSASAKTEEDATKVAQDGVEQEAPEDEVSTAVAAFRELAGELDAGKLEALLRAVGAGQAVEPLVLQPDADKVHRTAVHNFFKTRLPMLVTDTGEARRWLDP